MQFFKTKQHCKIKKKIKKIFLKKFFLVRRRYFSTLKSGTSRCLARRGIQPARIGDATTVARRRCLCLNSWSAGAASSVSARWRSIDFCPRRSFPPRPARSSGRPHCAEQADPFPPVWGVRGGPRLADSLQQQQLATVPVKMFNVFTEEDHRRDRLVVPPTRKPRALLPEQRPRRAAAGFRFKS